MTERRTWIACCGVSHRCCCRRHIRSLRTLLFQTYVPVYLVAAEHTERNLLHRVSFTLAIVLQRFQVGGIATFEIRKLGSLFGLSLMFE